MMARDYERDGRSYLAEELGNTSRDIEKLYERLVVLRFAVREGVNSHTVDEAMNSLLDNIVGAKQYMATIFLGTIDQGRKTTGNRHEETQE